MRAIDVSAFVGTYPFRDLGEAGSASWLVSQMDRLGIDQAWVGYLPSMLQLDPAPGNRALGRITAAYQDRLRAVPTINPELPRWQDDINEAFAMGAPAVRLFPQYQGIEPAGDEMRIAVAAAAAAQAPVILTVSLEDRRQRHPLDVAPEFPAAAVRTLIRCDDQARMIVTNADAAFIEEVFFGSTAAEAERLFWDITRIWGPPGDDLARLIASMGPERFVFGSGMPLQVPDVSVARLALLGIDDASRTTILSGNVRELTSS